MANKYIRHGETYCGDGTTSAEAASAGAAGAWNDINILEGTTPPQGALAAGDVVYIRSLDSAGAALTRTVNAASVTLGNAAGIAANPVTWILDGGIVWPGVSGVLTYNCYTSYLANLRSHNRFFADVYDAFVVVEKTAAAAYKSYGIGANCWLKNVKYDFSVCTSAGYAPYLYWSASIGYAVWENLHYIGAYSASHIAAAGYGTWILINPDIELPVNTGVSNVIPISSSTRFECYGGQVRGAGATTGVSLITQGGSGVSCKFVGTQWPRTLTPFNVPSTTYQTEQSNSFEAIGLDGGVGAMYVDMWGSADSRTDNYYPTLNATFANSASTPWSWKLYPQNAAVVRPLRMTVAKMFTEAAATKTVTLELLIADTLTAANLGTLWADIQYIDNATGLTKHVSTKVNAGGALTASTAPWTATTYGAVNLLKRKLSAETPTAIKQDTMVVVTLHGTFASASANDIMFLDPDVGMV